jgi:hypothetical protein
LVSNPEFLKEGAAVDDFMRPDRVVIGADNERATLLMRSLYAQFVRNHHRVLVMDRRSAEFAKYAANAMLATRIGLPARPFDKLRANGVGMDIEMVRLCIGTDPRGHNRAALLPRPGWQDDRAVGPGHRHRVEGVPHARLRGHQGGPAHAGGVRWAQPVRAGADGGVGD